MLKVYVMQMYFEGEDNMVCKLEGLKIDELKVVKVDTFDDSDTYRWVGPHGCFYLEGFDSLLGAVQAKAKIERESGYVVHDDPRRHGMLKEARYTASLW